MKIKTRKMSYEQVSALPRGKHRKPLHPNFLLQTVVRVAAILDLVPTRFRYTTERMDAVGKEEPCLILMNHSCFLDLQIASRIFYPRHYCIVCTTDAFVGMGGLMGWLMRTIGCIPTQKFVTDISLIQDMTYCFKELKTSVLMFPEAGYSFDGTATTLPRKMGVLLKKLDVPVVMAGVSIASPSFNFS